MKNKVDNQPVLWSDEIITDVPTFSPEARLVVCCDDVLQVCKTLPEKTFQLIVSSPPYNIGKEYEKTTTVDSYLNWQDEIIEHLVRLVKDSGSIVWQVGNYVKNGEIIPLDILFYPIFKKHGLFLRNRIIWHFEHGLHATKRFSGRYETLLWFTKSEDYLFNLDPVRVPSKYPGKLHFKGKKKGLPSGNPLGKNPSDFWNFLQSEYDAGIIDIPNVKSNHPEKTEHPCQFPVELIQRCVLALTDEDDWVLDPFGGVGSSVIAALSCNRKGMCIDRDLHYCDIARDRIRLYQEGKLHLRPIGKPIYVPTGREKVVQVPDEWKTERRAQ
ncbi:MAG: site-specific DNA-methyltransferase [Planctomycetia bacterium]|nr:site-specific DNA-methyltransferase [Planctomycetia bacterium]